MAHIKDGDRPPLELTGREPFTELKDGWCLITLKDGRQYKIRDVISQCPYCDGTITRHECWPVRREEPVRES